MIKSIITTFFILAFIGTLAGLVIAYGKGWRLNVNQKSLTVTGILSASSFPDKASVFVNDKLVAATDASISLPPDWYDLKITKEGYQTWEKRIRIQGEIVSQIDVLLIPKNPSLKALTTTGVVNSTLSPSSEKIAYFTQEGVWMLNLETHLLSLRSTPVQLFLPLTAFDPTKARLVWSPDEQYVLFEMRREGKLKNEFIVTKAYLLSISDPNSTLDVTNTRESLLKEWDSTRKKALAQSLLSLPVPIQTILASHSSNLLFSPDETKILFEATAAATLPRVIDPPLIGSNPTQDSRTLVARTYYVYDVKEDKNFPIIEPAAGTFETYPAWYSDSKHIVFVEQEAIVIVDYDGSNKRAIYTGPFEKHVLYPLPGGNKLMILTRLSSGNTAPDLYEIDLR